MLTIIWWVVRDLNSQIAALKVRCFTNLANDPISLKLIWLTWLASNQQPLVSETSALPVELQAKINWSGWRDLNSRLPAPKAGALPG